MRRRALTAWIAAVCATWSAGPTLALPELWTRLCAGCHANDNPTCAGCHNHRGRLEADATRHAYRPGESVRVWFRGGNEPGWIRALLYDETGAEIDRATGPTGSGDDARGTIDPDSVAFPLVLRGWAPDQPGSYTWRAAYFGIFQTQNVTHDEEWIPVVVNVSDAPEDTLPTGSSWGRLKERFR